MRRHTIIGERNMQAAPALSREDAIAELHRCAGTQFDPAVVTAFVAVLEQAEHGDALSAAA